jgi:hypothetical protein
MQENQPDYSTNLVAHAAMLAEFFTTLFDPRDQVLILPGLDEVRYKALCVDLGDHPNEIAGRETIYPDHKAGRLMPRRFLDPFTRSPTSTRTTNLTYLHELNRHGYGIYFAINPVLGRRRCQKAVLMAKHILIESDNSDVETQMGFLDVFEKNVVSSVHSGGKSIHHLIRISPFRWNPHRVRSQKAAMALPKGDTKAPWQEYRDMADYWVAMASAVGVKADVDVAHDHARVSRVPGFLHQVTGKVSTMLRLNPTASWYWREALAEWKDGEEDEAEDEDVEAHRAEREASLGEGVKDMLNGDDGLFPELSPFGRGRQPWWEETKQADHGCMAETGRQADLGVLKEDLEVCETTTTNVVRSTCKMVQFETLGTSFLDAVEHFEQLKRYGLPGRHTRRSRHRTLFETARVFGWNETRMAEEWENVIRRNSTATVETVDGAVENMLAAWNASPDVGLYLPNLTRLPEIDQGHMAKLEVYLVGLGCREAHKASRIIAKVILPVITNLPRQCMNGTVGIRSTNLRDVTNIRGCPRGYKDVWLWLQAVGFVTCTNPRAVPGVQTRKYRVNVPLVLWACGFRTKELDWSKTARNFWPEISRLRVVDYAATLQQGVDSQPVYEV